MTIEMPSGAQWASLSAVLACAALVWNWWRETDRQPAENIGFGLYLLASAAAAGLVLFAGGSLEFVVGWMLPWWCLIFGLALYRLLQQIRG